MALFASHPLYLHNPGVRRRGQPEPKYGVTSGRRRSWGTTGARWSHVPHPSEPQASTAMGAIPRPPSWQNGSPWTAKCSPAQAHEPCSSPWAVTWSSSFSSINSSWHYLPGTSQRQINILPVRPLAHVIVPLQLYPSSTSNSAHRLPHLLLSLSFFLPFPSSSS